MEAKITDVRCVEHNLDLIIQFTPESGEAWTVAMSFDFSSLNSKTDAEILDMLKASCKSQITLRLAALDLTNPDGTFKKASLLINRAFNFTV